MPPTDSLLLIRICFLGSTRSLDPGSYSGGWQFTGITTLQSGNPFTVTLGYDVNADGLGCDRPRLADVSMLGRSIDNGRQLTSTGESFRHDLANATSGYCVYSGECSDVTGDQRIFLPGTPGDGTLGRNTFFTHGLNYTDMTFGKEFRFTRVGETRIENGVLQCLQSCFVRHSGENYCECDADGSNHRATQSGELCEFRARTMDRAWVRCHCGWCFS